MGSESSQRGLTTGEGEAEGAQRGNREPWLQKWSERGTEQPEVGINPRKMDALRLLGATMGRAVSCDQDIGVGDGSAGKKPPGFLGTLEERGWEGSGKRQWKFARSGWK